ncbi:MAG: hypothetical protein ACOX6N_05490, partial [Patescibacteria group bacterium]
MKKLLLVLFLFVFSQPAFAGNDVTVNCSSVGCDIVDELPLFHDTNISPGYSASQTLTIVNNRPEVCFLGVQLENNQTDISLLSDVIQINIGDISHTLRFLLMS